MRSVSAILLAAGESTRMGRQKALMTWLGTTLIQYQLQQLADVEAIAQIIVVTGHEPGEIERLAAGVPRAISVRNDAYRTGKVSSIRAGLSRLASGNAVLLLAIDQPRRAAIHRCLIERHTEAASAITVPTHDGRRGHPIVFNGGLLPELLDISEETQGVRAMLRRHQVTEVAFDDPSVILDLNTPSDLDRTAN